MLELRHCDAVLQVDALLRPVNLWALDALLFAVVIGKRARVFVCSYLVGEQNAVSAATFEAVDAATICAVQDHDAAHLAGRDEDKAEPSVLSRDHDAAHQLAGMRKGGKPSWQPRPCIRTAYETVQLDGQGSRASRLSMKQCSWTDRVLETLGQCAATYP